MGLFGLSVKKIEKNLKPLMKKINLANAPKGYSKSSIDYVASVDTDKACPSCSACKAHSNRCYRFRNRCYHRVCFPEQIRTDC